MKTVLVFACLLAVGLVDSSLESEKQILEDIHEKCQSNPKTYADDELLADLPKNIHNPQVGAHMLCESKGVGLQDKNGKLNDEVIKCKIRLSTKDESEVDPLVKKCAIQKKTPEITAVHLFMCLDKFGVKFFHDFNGHGHGHGHGRHRHDKK